MAKKHGNIDGQQDLFQYLFAETEETQNEQIRRNRTTELAEPMPSAEPEPTYGILREPGGSSPEPDTGTRNELSGRRSTTGGVPSQGGADQRSQGTSTGDRSQRATDTSRDSVGTDRGRVGTARSRRDRAESTDPRISSSRADEVPGGLESSAYDPTHLYAPEKPIAKQEANLNAIELLRTLEAENREATDQEKVTLASWTGWGSVGLSEIFNEAKPEYSTERERLKNVLSSDEYKAASRTTLNAHYTPPVIAQTLWGALEEYGFDGGKVLEPGSGIGTFIGLAPQNTQITAVELDPITARLSGYLHPQAAIRQESFADTAIPANYFDATIGNVPFSPNILHDPRHNRSRLSMHNHFINKSIDLTKPGGLVAVISSTYTLDSSSDKARQEIYSKADLLGAYRLPEHTFTHSAGTDTMTDVLIFRKREDGQDPLSDEWTKTYQVNVQGSTITRNGYFQENPDHLLGESVLKTNQWGHAIESVQVSEGIKSGQEENTAHLLNTHIRTDASAHKAQGYGYQKISSPVASGMPLIVPDENLVDGHITDRGEGSFTIYQQGIHEELKVPQTQREELSTLLSLRDQARALISTEARQSEDSEAIINARQKLREDYLAYQEKYGPINRFTETETKTGTIIRRGAPVISTLRKDPYGVLVTSLEIFDNATQKALPADILNHRILEPRKAVEHVDSPADALALSLDQKGNVDPEYIGQLLGKEPKEALALLDASIFEVPGNDSDNPRWETREEYLSGDVRKKLAQAQIAAVENPRFEKNLQALEKVIPTDLGPSEIAAKVGAAWIPDTDHQQFLREEIGDRYGSISRISGSSWSYTGENVLNPGGWGTKEYPPYRLLGALAEQKPIQVFTSDAEGKKVLDPQATAMAQDRAEKIQERFSQWIWEDPERSARLSQKYNETFNNLVLRDYTEAGKALTLPGLVKSFTPRDHQRTAVARMLNEPAVGLFHQVGAGKTAEMVMGTMELKRLGLVQKPCVVVPNHMLEQFSREWLSMYPQAKLLPASSQDLTGDKRRAFVAKVASNDWDAVIMTHSSFGKISLTPKTKGRYLEQEIALQRENLSKSQERAAAENTRMGRSAKALERSLQAQEEKYKALLDKPHDPGVSFEETGIDYLCVDELHEFKNLMTNSAIPDAAIAGSEKATDLHLKISYLREHHGDRVITGATGTPIANSMSEMYVMERYLRPDLLEASGIEDFDTWAATFGQTVTEMEMTVAGGDSFRLKTRFAKFQNVPELLRQFHTFGDVKTQEDLNLPVPQIVERPDGQRLPHALMVEPTADQQRFVEELAQRYEDIRGQGPTAGADNALKITSDGRKAAADMRLIDPAYLPDGQDTKASQTAALLAKVYEETKDNKYLVPGTNELHPTPGALQVVFCDLGTPKDSGKFSMYQEIKDQAVQRGIPEEKIRFIHEANNDLKKARLFEQCRSGEVAVLIGSTQKMGVGTNIQARLAHMVHIDAPWRPADVEQRNGRILRQGNQNPEVMITQVATRGSVDSFMLQTLERKAKFINQVMRGSLDVREIEDIGDASLSFAEFKAASTGNPLFIEKANADQLLTKYERLERSHRAEQTTLQFQKATSAARISRLEESIPKVEKMAQQVIETSGDAFRMRVGEQSVSKRAEAVDAIKGWSATNASMRPPYEGKRNLGVFASVGGFEFEMVQGKAQMSALGESPVDLVVSGAEHLRVQSSWAEVLNPGLGLVTRMENVPGRISRTVTEMKADLATEQKAYASYEARLGQEFEYADALVTTKAEVKRLDQQLREYQQAKEQGKEPKGVQDQSELKVLEHVSRPEPQAQEITEVDIDRMISKLKKEEPQVDEEMTRSSEHAQENNERVATEGEQAQKNDALERLEEQEREIKKELEELKKQAPGSWARMGQAQGELEALENEGRDMELRVESGERQIRQDVENDFQDVRDAQQALEESSLFSRGKSQQVLEAEREKFSGKYGGAETVEAAVLFEVQRDPDLVGLKSELAEHTQKVDSARDGVAEAMAYRDAVEAKSSQARRDLQGVRSQKAKLNPQSRAKGLAIRAQVLKDKVSRVSSSPQVKDLGFEK